MSKPSKEAEIRHKYKNLIQRLSGIFDFSLDQNDLEKLPVHRDFKETLKELESTWTSLQELKRK